MPDLPEMAIAPYSLPATALAPAARNADVKVSRALLLRIYGIVPACVALVFLDQVFLGRRLRPWLQGSPDSLLLFASFFVLPHIVASAISFFDREYLSHYRKRILPPLLMAGLGLLAFPRVTETPFFLVGLYLWTVVHVIGQQFGMIRVMGKDFGPNLVAWKWIAITIGAVLYVGVTTSAARAGEDESRTMILTAGGALLLPFGWLGWRVYRRAASPLGRRYVSANAGMIAAAFAFYALGYPFLVVLMPRWIHDLSAFAFYAAHDRDRNRDRAVNLLYRGIHSAGIPLRYLGPWIAVLLAFPLTYREFGGDPWALRVIAWISLFHYYTDGFAWKRGSPHRSHIRLS